ncbi:MAG: DNA repair exonuclease [Geminicoccaceae bacterium]|nr:DNA repair exonuclease [Geminicoccaceae bacterium]
MTVRILHTADWHLGCPFRQIPGDAGALLRERRLEMVGEIAGLARARRVDAVLVAGDVFDDQHVEDAVLRRTLDQLARFAGPWILLPGNHDAALAESVWTRLRRLGLPPGIVIADRPEPIAIAAGRAQVLPAPLRHRRTPEDLTAWMDTAATPAGAIRIGLAHGILEGLHPEAGEATNPIARDRALRARLDHLALGDRHGTLEAAARTWYAGTPEPDGYRYREAGQVLLVELDEPGAPPRIEAVAIGRFHWLERRLELAPSAPEELALRIEALRRELPAAAERCVLRLALTGSVDLAGRRALDSALAGLAAALRHLETDDRLLLQPTAVELDRLDDGGPIGVCARALAQRAASSGNEEERAVAALALRLLWQELAGLDSGRESVA